MRPTRHLAHPDLLDETVLPRIAERLKAVLGAKQVLVYGSVARGDATIHSDIDLLIIAPSTDKPYLRMAQARGAIRDLSFGLPISPMVLTPDEVQRRLLGGDQFIRDILNLGVAL